MLARLKELIDGIVSRLKAAIASLAEYQEENVALKAENADLKQKPADTAALPAETEERIQALLQEAATAKAEAETAKADLAVVKQQDVEEEGQIQELITYLEAATPSA
ncbi:MAG: hypothetical protein KME45_03340 [Stenomitos rutilans HA7619-LM2]|jgi:regulator of replication initiation timing|nr:hypothetical protein [Stenomitos rutilans HA7619-LM2]MBW4469419.1 hypothetical protein [Stenomitos rutilans HA7619-LM2]